MAERSRGARRLLPVPVPLLVLLLLLLMAGSAASPADEGGGGRREAGGGEPGDEAAPHDSSYGTFASEFYDLRYLSEEGALRGRDGTGRHGTGRDKTGRDGAWGSRGERGWRRRRCSARRPAPAAIFCPPRPAPRLRGPHSAGTPQQRGPHNSGTPPQSPRAQPRPAMLLVFRNY